MSLSSTTSGITPTLKYVVVKTIKDTLSPELSNTYVGIGIPKRWGDAFDPESQNEISPVFFTTNYRNDVFKTLVAIKMITDTDTALVVPRVDWANNKPYDAYSDSVELFSHYDKTTISGTVNASGNLITTNTATLVGSLSSGNTITLNTETKQIISVNATSVIVNSSFSYSVTDKQLVKYDSTYPYFANNFYVRNSKDQVFKCLFNNSSANSTVEPNIDIDGQLPENPYILSSDGYKWKYLYTIPYGLKQKFFTLEWMPVVEDNGVVAGSVDGRIDIVDIVSGGTGYFLDNGESGNSTSLSILTVVGDGTGASMTAKVESGVITKINILNGGSEYTYANILIDDPDQLSNGNTANLVVSVSPPKGHGSNPVTELGCYTIMISLKLDGTESDTIPVGTDDDPFDYRQICLIRDPLLANGSYAAGTNYRATTKISLTDPGISNYANDETVYIGSSLAAANMTATVVNWNPSTNELFVNDIKGNVVVGSTLTGNTSAATATILSSDHPDIELFTGDVLYIENRSKIVRDVDQSEQIRIAMSLSSLI